MSEIKQSLLLTLLGGLNTRQCLVALRHCQPDPDRFKIDLFSWSVDWVRGKQ